MKLENIVDDCYQNDQNVIPEDDEKSQKYKYAGTPGAVHVVTCDLCFCKSSRLLITALVDDDEAMITDDYQMIKTSHV